MTNHRFLRTGLLLTIVAAAAMGQTTTSNSYLAHNLVSDLAGIADHQDSNLVNPWGNGFGATPFWIGNNGTGTSTLYDGTGAKTALTVTIPQAGGTGHKGPVTGVIFNAFASNTSAFTVAAAKPANFIFCSTDGVISGWNSTASGTDASILFDNSKSGAAYTGCALGGTSAVPLLFAANFGAGTIDTYDASLNLNTGAFAKTFLNPTLPAGFSPFNVEVINGSVYVAYAKQDPTTHRDVGGVGNGYVAWFDQSGNLLGNLISQGVLNSPWGMAIAPSSFGAFAGALLVGNFRDGTINAYNTAGKPLGTLNDTTGKAIAIPGLWSLNFGSGSRNEDPGTLYFTAGIGGGPNNDPIESHGLLGSIQAAPTFVTSGISSGAVGVAGLIAPNSWATIKGSGLSETTGNWVVTGSIFPTTPVNGVSVSVNGEAASVSFVSNQQINFLVPADIPTGTAQIQVTNNGLISANITATVGTLAPAFFPIGTVAATGHSYITATHLNFTFLAPVNFLTAAVPTSPAEPNETIILFGTGFGPTIPGQVALPVNPTVVIDGFVAPVTFAGMISPGLYQINTSVPSGVTRGQDVFVVALLGNNETQANAYIAIAAQ
jgi:uncharacterized protein (TIGR03118 family)